jgi:hypothetical protein
MKKFLTLFSALLLLGSMMTVSAEDTYVVAGTENLFGSDWSTTDANNAMTLQDGKYRLVKENTGDNSLSVQFKVVKNGSWSSAYPSSNYSISVPAKTKLLITYTTSGNAVDAKILGGYVGAHGTMTNSNWATVQFTAASNKETASHTYSLTAGSYSFGMRVGSSGNWTSNGSSFTRANNSRTITSGSGNCSLTADIDGDYTFTWTYETNTLTVTYPDLPAQTVDFSGLATEILKGTAVNFAATSSGITNPSYTFYVKPAGGSYGSASASYTFNTAGNYVVKVVATGSNTTDPVAKEKNVTIYDTYTFHTGDVIKVDFSDVSGDAKGVNYPFGNVADPGNPLDYDANGAGTIKTITFTQDVEWSTLSTFIKTAKNGWAGLNFQVPSPNYNVAKVAADGASFTWILVPTVEFSNIADSYLTGNNVALAATSNLTNVSFTYQVKIGEGEFTDIAGTAYTFAAAGNYTFKVTATGDEGNISATKDVTVYNPLTLYFVNKEGWANVNLYLFDPAEKATWPGDPMTLTAETTDRNGYSVYSFVIPAGVYAQAIFNNGSAQTSDLTINNSKPYYYDGEWYATLAECDQPVLTTNFYLAGSFNGWNTTSDRFMKVNESDTETSVTISITEYSNITFKVMEGAAYCGSSDAITKDATTATIAEAGAGNDIAMTPYAAGDYIFTLNLSTRQLTVTYPSGDPMPIPQNIFLAGEMNSWAPANNDYKFAVSGDVATLEVTTLEAMHDYEFKLVYNGTWLRADYDFKYYWCSDVAFSAGDGDGAKIYTFKAGTYTFTYNLTSGQLSIAYPATSATDVEISQYEYATLYSATAFDVPDNVEAYVISGIDGIRLASERIYHIPANTGVLLHAPQGTYQFYEGDGRYMDPVGTNLLKGSTANQEIDNELVHYVLSYDNDFQVGFYWPYGTGAAQGVGAFTNNAGKAYLEIPANSQPSGVIARRGFPLVMGAGVPTGIEDLNTNAEQTKFIYNGQLLIQHNGLLFNAQGARVR